MNKKEFIAQVADTAGLTKKYAGAAVEATLKTISDELANGGSVQFIGFGAFSTSIRAERQGVNPATGKAITIKSATVPKFKAGAALKAAVN